MVKVDDTLIAWIIGGAALSFTLDSVLIHICYNIHSSKIFECLFTGPC